MYRSELLTGQSWIEHGFGTRNADPWGDAASPELVGVKQVHSSRVLTWRPGAGRGPALASMGEADGLITDAAGAWLTIRTADCVPILFADPERGVIGAAHAGWRGTVANIAGAVLVQMAARFGTQPEDVVVAIGPAIGRCCFEVGPEVAGQFQPWWPETRLGHIKTHVDLSETIVRQLTQAGVPLEGIDAEAPCTKCGGEFHSYRRDGERAGRMHSGIRIVP
jgi:hypothetical protein